MTTASEHGRILLSAIIPDRRDLLDDALRHLTPDHFLDRTQRALFQMLERYAEVTGSILTRAALGDLLHTHRADAGTVALYSETFDALHDAVVDKATFRWSLDQIRELAAERETNQALTSAMEILTRGVTDEQGDTLRGHADARVHVLQRFAEIDRGLAMQESPEGDMRAEADDIMADYIARETARAAGHGVGIEFGIPELDERLSGVQPGELGLIVAFTAHGKTSLVVQLGWHASVVQGKNVVILTTETVRNQVRRRLVARHSCLEFFGIPGGINSRDIKNGTLTAQQKEQFAAVVTDFGTNPGYGHCYIVQVPRSATVGYIESKLLRIQRMFGIDLVIMDYLALLKPERRRNTSREELGDILKETKQLATTFNNGAGIPFVSPWQVNRAARQESQNTLSYTASALAETAEASNSADLIISLLAPVEDASRTKNIKMQIMKNRDGETANPFDVQVDYATSRFSEALVGRAQSVEDLFSAIPLS